ncbi:hypothetical protein LCGC14_1941370, partial [marine sediment metagenome]
GYFSARGYISIIKRTGVSKKFYEMRLTLHFDNLRDAELFKENFGGTVNILSQKATNKRKYRWQIYGGEAGYFMKVVQPYLIGNLIKKKVKLALSYHNYIRKHYQQQNEAYRKHKHQFYLQMKRLK